MESTMQFNCKSDDHSGQENEEPNQLRAVMTRSKDDEDNHNVPGNPTELQSVSKQEKTVANQNPLVCFADVKKLKQARCRDRFLAFWTAALYLDTKM
jgi:hypothetical protein